MPWTSERWIERAVSRMHANGAPGPNGLPGSLFRANASGWSTVLAPLYNACYAEAKVPHSWRGSVLCPIYKQGARTSPQNYRLIALLDLEAKGYAQLLLKDLEDWVQENKILLVYETGFRPFSSTMDNVVALAHLAHQAARSQQRPLFCCLVDYSAAFDNVDRHMLWDKLSDRSIPVHLLAAIYLCIRTHG